MILIRKTGEIHPIQNQPLRTQNWLGADWCDLPAHLLSKHNGGYCELVFEGDKLVDLIPTERPEPETTVEDLKTELAATDYKALKYMEGWLSEEEYAPIKAERQTLRDRINALQGERNQTDYDTLSPEVEK